MRDGSVPFNFDSGVDAGADGGIDAGPPEHVRIAVFNVRLFFDTVCQSGACTPADFEEVRTQAQFDARATQVANAVAGFNADVVGLEEIENQTCLDAIIAKLDGGMPYGVIGEIGTAGSVDVAVLSKTPIDRVVAHRALQRLTRPDGSITSFSREFLEVEVHTPRGQSVVFFGAHFRSKVSDDPGRRLAEAQVSRQVVEARATASPGSLVVMGGDLNDTPGSPPLDALTSGNGLIRVADDLPVADQATYVFNGMPQAIDHLLQARTNFGVRIPMSSRTWRGNPGYAGSDHYALTSDFELRPVP
ncbi:MAG: endonuclease/exonuclease/phosphatase family protein [Archangium sp.]